MASVPESTETIKNSIKDTFGVKKTFKCESPQQQTTTKLIKLENNRNEVKKLFNCETESLKMEKIEPSSTTNENSSPWLFASLQLQHHLQQQQLPITTSALEFSGKIE